MKKLISSQITLRHLTVTSALATLVACTGPVDVDPGDPDGYGAGGQAAEGGGYGTGANGYGTGGFVATGGSETGGAPGTGGVTGHCTTVQPKQTYICAGDVYESEAAGAASLSLISMPSSYACDDSGGYWGTGGVSVGGSPAGGAVGWGGELEMGDDEPYYPARDESDDESLGLRGVASTGGAPATGGASPTGGASTGGASTGGASTGGASTGGASTGGASTGGASTGGASTGGASPTGGGPGVGGSPNQLSNWCEDARPQDSIAGITFAVGECQAVDVALPLVFREPSYGDYELSIYGGYDQCDRGALLVKTAGIGTGLVHEIPVDASGYTFLSVQFVTDGWQDIEVRLKDRPRVKPSEE